MVSFSWLKDGLIFTSAKFFKHQSAYTRVPQRPDICDKCDSRSGRFHAHGRYQRSLTNLKHKVPVPILFLFITSFRIPLLLIVFSSIIPLPSSLVHHPSSIFPHLLFFFIPNSIASHLRTGTTSQLLSLLPQTSNGRMPRASKFDL